MSKGVMIPNQYLSKGPFYPYAFYQLSYRQDVNLKPVSMKTWRDQLGIKIDWDNMINHKTRAIYFPTLYLPQAFIAGLAGRVFDAPVAIIYYLLRLSYLFTFAAATYLAIRITPIGMWILGILSVTPMALIQASIISPDSINNGISFIFFAWVLYLNKAAVRDTFSRRDWIITAVLVAALCSLKLNSLPLLLLLFLIPRPKLGSQKWLIAFIAVTMASILVIFVGWNWLTSSELSVISTGETSPALQLKGIFTNPLFFIQAVTYNIQTQCLRYFIEWVGVSGYGYWNLPGPVYWITPLLILLALLADSSNDFLTTRVRVWLGVIFLAVSLGTISIFYLIYNPPNSILIPGVQGRYFINAVPLLLLALLPRSPILKPGGIWFQAGSVLIALLSLVGLILVYHVTCGSSFYSPGLCYLPQYKNWSPKTSLPLTLSGQAEARQTFVSDCENLVQVKVWVASNDSAAQGSLSVEIQNPATREPIRAKSFLSSEIPGSGWLDFNFPPIVASKMGSYALVVKPANNSVKQDIGIAYSKTNEVLNGSLMINGEKNDGDLLFQYGCLTGLEHWKTSFTK